jgi:SH3-like domain-containing protein
VRSQLHDLLKVALSALILISAPAYAGMPDKGRTTGLPLPRYVSLKTSEGNVRRGPSLTHRIDWIYQESNLPLQITAEYGHWRRVKDRDGEGGWIHYSLLSGSRYAIVNEDDLPILNEPTTDAEVQAIFERDVLARLQTCTLDWCEISAGGYSGWVQKTHLWGVLPEDIFE